MNFFGWGRGPDWEKQVQGLENIFTALPSTLMEPEGFRRTIRRIADQLPADLKHLKKEARFVFAADGDEENLARNNVDLLRQWHIQGNAPSLAALCIHAVEQFQLHLPADLMQPVLAAAVLGEIENALPYHNNMHFRKVLLQLLRLVAVHNDIYEETPRAFAPEDVALLMIAACIHDLGHDGKGNMLKGVFVPGRMEKASAQLARPYLKVAGLTEENKLEALQIMLLCTDVAPLNDPANMMNQMKAAYRFHFLGQKGKTESLNLDAEIARLEKDPVLTMMCLILHEADIATSAGLDYEVTKYETALYRCEIGDDEARPSHIVDFLNNVCQRHMLSDAGQELYAANMARIFALAEQDLRDGNHPFPKVEYSLFMTGDSGRGSKTVN